MKKLFVVFLIFMLLAGCAVPEGGPLGETQGTTTPETVISNPTNDATAVPSETLVSEIPQEAITESPFFEPDDPDTSEEVWGALEEHEGGLVWGTLTEEQQSYVNYPVLNEDCVYWTPGGSSYHAVSWCYALSNSKEILSGTIEEARAAGKTDPCSKCVGH